MAEISGNPAIEKLPNGSIAGYQLISTAIIAPRCLECHSASGGNAGGTNLESYSNVQANLASIRNEVTSGAMPKNRSPLSLKEKEVFLAWIDAGGPLETTTPTIDSPEDMPYLEKIDYQMVRTQVIGLRCISCHSDAGENQGAINLETYENVFEQKEAIKDAVGSGAMPLSKRPLTFIQKEILLSWLEKGAPEGVPQKNPEEL